MREQCRSRTLPVGGQGSVREVVAGHTLVSHDASAVKTRQRETTKSAHLDLVGFKTRNRADGIVLSEFDVRQMQCANRHVAR